MIDLYYWTTPNGHKITIFLEEVELPISPEQARDLLFNQSASTIQR